MSPSESPDPADRARPAPVDALDVPVPVAMRLREAGLLSDDEQVRVITTTPPPVRRQDAPLVIDGLPVITDTPPPVRGEARGPRPRGLAYTAPVVEDDG